MVVIPPLKRSDDAVFVAPLMVVVDRSQSRPTIPGPTIHSSSTHAAHSLISGNKYKSVTPTMSHDCLSTCWGSAPHMLVVPDRWSSFAKGSEISNCGVVQPIPL